MHSCVVPVYLPHFSYMQVWLWSPSIYKTAQSLPWPRRLCTAWSLHASPTYLSHPVGLHTPVAVALLSVLKEIIFLLSLSSSHLLCSMLIHPLYLNICLSFKSLLKHHFLREALLGPFSQQIRAPNTSLLTLLSFSSILPPSLGIVLLFV